MRHDRRRGLAMIAATIGGLVLSTTPAQASTTSAAPLSTVGSAPLIPSGATLSSPLSAEQTISFDVVLKPRNQAALDAFVRQVSTPGSPQYHQFLKHGEFGPRFGATSASIAAVTRSLRSQGLSVQSVSESGLVVQVAGSAAKVGKALHTSFRNVRMASGRDARTNVSAPELPSTVANLVQSVVGLNTTMQAHHTPIRAGANGITPAPISPQTQGLQPNTSCPGTGSGYYTPGQLAAYYGTTSFAQGGSGVTVALFELEQFNSADITTFQQCYGGGSGTISTILVDGGPPAGSGTGTEATLDIDDVIGLAPNANIKVYEAPNGSGILDEYQQIANDDAEVVSTSWGLCESLQGSATLDAERSIFQQMAAQGQTVFAAAGDDGSEGCYHPPDNTSTALDVVDPASQPEVTGVGGTNLESATGPEDVWNESASGSGAGGGGMSSTWSMPAWQQPLGVIAGESTRSCGGGTSYCREVPDVSASADPVHAYLIYQSGWYRVGGTSAAAPTWASLIAAIDSACPAGRLGLINPALYQLEPSGVFNDIATGRTNDYTGSHPGDYPTLTHYDMATGLGTPKGATLGSSLCPTSATDGAGTMTAGPTAVPVSSHATVTFTYTAPVGQALTDGKLAVTVPADWSAPSTSSATAGYTTASAGMVSTSGQTITVNGVTTMAGGTVTIVYGDTSGGEPGALTPAVRESSTFTAESAATPSGVLTPLTSGSPAVLVGTATDGSGTLTATSTPATVLSSQNATLTFVYTPPSGTGLTDGEVDVEIPSDWTPPSATAAAGYVTASGGTGGNTVAVSGSGPWTIAITSVSLDLGQTLTIVYGDSSGGGSPATAPPTGQTAIFAAQQQATAAGSLTALAASPHVAVQGPAVDGSGTMSVSPSTVDTATSDTLVFTYWPGANSTVTNGEIDVVIPSDWTEPAGTPDAGYVTASGGSGTDSVAVPAGPIAGPWTVAVTGVTLSAGQQLTVTYGATTGGGSAAVAPSNPETSTFSVSMMNAGGSLTSLAASPSVTVASPPPPPPSGGGGGGGGIGHPDLERVSGPDRIATSIAASQAAFADPNSARVVVLARSDSYADALAGTPLAAANNGPLLLTTSSSLPDSVVGEIGRVLPIGSKIYLLGGTVAISSSIENELAGFGYQVQRLAGNSRYDTAVAVANAMNNPPVVFEADGTNFPDALSAGSAAVHEGGVILLTAGTTLPPATSAYLVAHPSKRYAIGGPAAEADPGATPIVGADRYATSILVAQTFFQAPISVGLASGQTFPDALSGGVVASLDSGLIVLVPDAGTVPTSTLSYLALAGNSASAAWLFGGTASVDSDVFAQAADALKPATS